MGCTHRFLLAGLLGLGAGCGPRDPSSDGDGDGTSTTADTSSSLSADETGALPGTLRPFRDQWRVEADLDFVHVDPGTGVPLINHLQVGGRETNDNFANRGDVIVRFDGPPNRMLIELRRFTMAVDEARAQEDYQLLALWAYSGDLAPPASKDPSEDCVTAGWHDDCAVRVYFDGLIQLARLGADIRVTLPPDYRHELSVATQDNDGHEDYINRGDVCISDLHATAEVETESGNVWVSLAPDTTPAPRCTPAQVQACDEWTEDGMPAAWAPECDCIAIGGGQFGLLDIENTATSASNIHVDVPASLWTTISAENSAAQGGSIECEVTIDVPGFESDPVSGDNPGQGRGAANFPGPPAIPGAGFTVRTTSESCGSVLHTPDPDGFVGVGNGGMQPSSERGDIRVCSGCIAQGCDALVP